MKTLVYKCNGCKKTAEISAHSATFYGATPEGWIRVDVRETQPAVDQSEAIRKQFKRMLKDWDLPEDSLAKMGQLVDFLASQQATMPSAMPVTKGADLCADCGKKYLGRLRSLLDSENASMVPVGPA